MYTLARLFIDQASRSSSTIAFLYASIAPLESPSSRFLRLALLDQHPAQVQAALNVRRILLQRLHERAHRRIAVARLPGREAEHVEAPDVVRVLARVAGEQPHRFVEIGRAH